MPKFFVNRFPNLTRTPNPHLLSPAHNSPLLRLSHCKPPTPIFLSHNNSPHPPPSSLSQQTPSFVSHTAKLHPTPFVSLTHQPHPTPPPRHRLSRIGTPLKRRLIDSENPLTHLEISVCFDLFNVPLRQETVVAF